MFRSPKIIAILPLVALLAPSAAIAACDGSLLPEPPNFVAQPGKFFFKAERTVYALEGDCVQLPLSWLKGKSQLEILITNSIDTSNDAAGPATIGYVGTQYSRTFDGYSLAGTINVRRNNNWYLGASPVGGFNNKDVKVDISRWNALLESNSSAEEINKEIKVAWVAYLDSGETESLIDDRTFWIIDETEPDYDKAVYANTAVRFTVIDPGQEYSIVDVADILLKQSLRQLKVKFTSNIDALAGQAFEFQFR
ncbi:MAG TPA: hypothetical protein VG966_00750 [Hyphomicrobiaceae bacterium]|nr:hypothetical protein [Hyphomicrobiaceae bacterium]